MHACTLHATITETVNADFSVSQVTTGEAVPLKRAPAWMRRPAGATFGFGGKLVSFANIKGPPAAADGSGQPHYRGQVTVSQV